MEIIAEFKNFVKVRVYGFTPGSKTVNILIMLLNLQEFLF